MADEIGDPMRDILLSKLAEFRNVSLERATDLRKRSTPADASDERWMALALQELDVAHEELRVVEEELHTQSEALAAAHTALERERRRYRDLFEGAPEPYLVTDVSGVVLEANTLACQLLNIEHRFIIGKPLALYIAPLDRAPIRDVLGLLSATGEVTTFELHMCPRGSAELVRVVTSVRRAISATREPTLALRWILHRLRTRRESAARETSALPAIESDTPARPTGLAEQLLSAQLAQANAENELTRRNGQLAFVAHELRNPLTVVAGWLQVLEQGDPSVASRNHLAAVLSRNVKMLTQLVEELIDQTRAAEGLAVIHCTPTDFRALLDAVCEDATGLAKMRQVSFSCEIDETIGMVQCDAGRIRQALLNVIGNALKFTPRGGWVQMDAKLRDGQLECLVRDNGPGLAPEHLESIFEPFVRVQKQSGGLGLGLNIARRMVELHGGHISAESEGIGKGACFRIRLPVSGPSAADPVS